MYRTTFDGLPVNYNDYAWSGFAVVFGTNLLGLFVIIIRRDIVWCVAATWLAVSVWSKRPKPGPVYVRIDLFTLCCRLNHYQITVILFTVLHPLALFGSMIYEKFYARQAIALPAEDEEIASDSSPDGRRPREVGSEAVWGR